MIAAQHGLEAVGIDSSPKAIEIAKRKARERGLNVRFMVHNALELASIGEQSLRRAIREFVTHYHHERNHQGLGNRLIVPNLEPQATGSVCRRPRLGGMLNYYYRGPLPSRVFGPYGTALLGITADCDQISDRLADEIVC